MVITHSGVFLVTDGPMDVYQLLTDPRRFAPLLPHFQSVEVKDEANYVVKIKVGVSHLRGLATVRLSLKDSRPREYARYTGTGKLVGGTVTLTAGFELERDPKGTRVKWTGQAQVFGKIASLARGLLEPLTKKHIDALIESLRGAMSGSGEEGAESGEFGG